MRKIRVAVITLVVFTSCSNQNSDPDALCNLLNESRDLNARTEAIPSDDYVEVTQNMTLYVELFDEMLDVAPKSVQSDFKTVRDFMTGIRDAKELAAGDRIVEIAEIQRAADEAVGLQAATARVLAYTRNECGFEL